ncbi:MAG: competence/damage-inducible protein A [Thermoanaerobaculia bacterium]
MKAAILAVGSELLGPGRLDTNSLKLTRLLRRYGVDLKRKAVVGDVRDDLADELVRTLGEVELTIVTGGLGPTADDVTREAVAQALGRSLVLRPEILQEIADKFARYRMRMPGVNRKQAEVIEGAEVIPNPRGTAPGQRIDQDGAALFLFPGVPVELEGMMEAALEPWLRERTGGEETETAVVRVACLPESAVEERVAPAYEEFGRQWISVLSAPGDIQVLLSAQGSAGERRRRLEAMRQRMCVLIGPAVYGFGEDESLEAVVGKLLRQSGWTVATAESCTGGLVAERLTRVAGSSDYFLGSAVTYSDRLKTSLLGVSPDDLERYGAVSEPVVRAMARGVIERLGADFGIADSGIAGPGGGSDAKPVGTVHVAVAGPGSGEVEDRELHLPGDRQRVRWLASQWGLEMLRRRLLKLIGRWPPSGHGGETAPE